MSTTPNKRLQGRPIRGEGDVGRDRLIEAARSLLRLRPVPDLSRKAVAEAAGVTPALVTYYFPDKYSLMRAATRPLVGERIDQIHAILDAPGTREQRFRQILVFLVGLNEAEAHLIDHAITLCRGDTADPPERRDLEAVYWRLREFYLDGVAAGEWRALDPDICLFALWGMCRAVVQGGRAVARPRAAPQDGADGDPRIDIIVALVRDGLRQPAFSEAAQ